MTGGVLETWVEELREEGRNEVLAEGEDKGARAVVKVLRARGVSDAEIVRELESEFEWEPEKAWQKLRQFAE